MRSRLLYSASHSTMSFAKGPKQPPPPTRVSDNLRSQDTIEVLLGLGEGPWSKLHDGLKSFYIANTPLQASDGTLNFPDAQLIFHKGSSMPDPVQFALGGSAAGRSVGVNLAQNSPVTRTTSSGDIDAIDVRLRVDQLFKATDEGDRLNEDLLFRIEVKPTSSGTWTSLPPNTGWIQDYTPPGQLETTSGFFGTIRQRVNQLIQDQSMSEYDAQVQAWAEYRNNADGPVDESLGVEAYSQNVRVYGATSSPVIKEIRIPVARLESDTYDIRVTKISAESTNNSVRELTWDTFEEIVIGDKAYPNTAMAQLIVKASDQLSNVPQMYGIYDTTEVLVPSIFDPTTRSYDFSGGPWDGTFKLAFTDDLAWIIYDLIHNDEHGIATYYPIGFSKYEALEASLFWNACDPVTGAYVGVPRPNGGTRPRVTFNGLIDTPRNSMELLTYMAGAGNAVFYEDVEGNFRLKVEKSTAATQTFNNMDVQNGRFQYSFSDTNTRYNDITVVYRNKKLPAYKEDRRRVYDQTNIDLYGRKPLTFVAVGCVDTDEALARAYHKLVTSLTETRQVSFTTTRFGAYVEPHDIILIADEAMDEGFSRRSMGLSPDRRTVTLNEPLTLEPDVFDYVVRVQTKDGIFETDVIEQNALSGGTTLYVSTPFPDDAGLDEHFSMSISSASEGDLRPYRVMSIEEGEADDEQIKISALEVNRAKYDLIDNFDGSIYDANDEDNTDLTGGSTSVSGLQAIVTERATIDGRVNDIELTWQAPVDSTTSPVYVIRYSLNDGTEREIYRGSDTRFVLREAPVGVHAFSVTTVSVGGVDAPQIRRIRVTTVEPNYGLPAIVGVDIQNRKNDNPNEYLGRTATIEWHPDTSEQWEGWNTGKPHPDFSHYSIDIVETGSGAIRKTIVVNDWLTRSLTISDADLIDITDRRNYAVVVSVSDETGAEGAAFTRNIVKPAIQLSNVELEQVEVTSSRVKMMFDPIEDIEFAGIKVWVHNAAGAKANGTLLWDAAGNPIVDVLDGQNWIAYEVFDVLGAGPTTEVTFTADILSVPDFIDQIQDEVDQNTQGVEGLVQTYGDTASAAQSAADALAAQGAAETAAQNSETARSQSVAARAAAEAARDAGEGFRDEAAGHVTTALGHRNDAQTAAGQASTSAGEAATSETNAAGSASSAATSAQTAAEARDDSEDFATASSDSATSAAASSNSAGQSASAADNSRLQAETARGQAQQSASNAATSETNATGAASTASTQAGLATQAANDAGQSANAAQNSANTASSQATAAGNSANTASTFAQNAQSSAGQASTSAGQAATSATNAAGSASAASTQAGIAVSAADQAQESVWDTYPTDVGNPENFGGNLPADPDPSAVASVQPTSFTPVNDPDLGPALQAVSRGYITYRKAIYVGSTTHYRVSTVIKTGSNVNATVYSAPTVYAYCYDGNNTYLGAVVLTPQIQIYNQPNKVEVTSGIYDVTNLRAGTVWFRPYCYTDAYDTGSLDILKTFEVIDASEAGQAAISASAAASSATAAAASSTSAGQFASAASSSAISADTARSGAVIAQNNAVAASNTAAGSASAASSSATLASAAYQNSLLAGQDADMVNCDSYGWLHGSAVLQKRTRAGTSSGSVMSVSGAYATLYAPITERIPIDTSKTYEIFIRARQNTSIGGRQIYAGLDCFDENDNRISGSGGTYLYAATKGGGNLPSNWTEYRTYITGESSSGYTSFRPGTTYVRRVALCNYPDGAGDVEIDQFYIREVPARADIQVLQSTATSLAGYASSSYGIQLNSNGVASGLTLRNSSNGTVSVSSILMESDILRHAVDGEEIWYADSSGLTMNKALRFTGGGTPSNPSTMWVLGLGFGAQDNLMEWFGPYSASIGGCTLTNARRARSVDGRTFLNGVEEGVGAVEASDTDTTSAQTAEIQNVGSNGNQVEATASATKSFSQTQSGSNASPTWSTPTSAGTVGVTLQRKINTGGYSTVASDTQAMTWEYTTSSYTFFDPEDTNGDGDFYETVYTHTRSYSGEASVTYTQAGSGSSSTKYSWKAIGSNSDSTSVSSFES